MSQYFRTLLKALRGVRLIPSETAVSSFEGLQDELDRKAEDLYRLKARHAALVAECTRHRDETWRLTH
jgi:hypothetical protein